MSNAERLLWFMLGVLGGVVLTHYINSCVWNAVRFTKMMPAWPI